MKNILFVFTLFGFFGIASVVSAKSVVEWTAVFDNVTPRNEKISMEYCKAHTPTVMVTTIDQITSKDGVKAANDVYVRYHSYISKKKDGLLFNIVNATISGTESNGPWSTPMKLYEQSLSEEDRGTTWTVWSTKDCKGTFIGTPRVIETK